MTDAEADETESVRVNFVLPKAKRNRWDEFVEENPEYSTRTDLIQTAVAHEIAGAHGNNGGPDTNELAIQMGELMDKMDDMMDRFGAMESDLQALKSETRKEPEIGKLATEVYQRLPDEEPGTEVWEAERNKREQFRTRDTEAEASYQAWLGTPHGLAEALNEPEYRIRDAIDKLLTDTHSVRETELHGETRYWRE